MSIMGKNEVLLHLDNVAIITQKHNYIIAKGPQEYVVLTPDRLKEELTELVDRVRAKNKLGGDE